MKALIIEPDFAYQDFLRYLLEERGWKVRLSPSLSSATAWLIERRLRSDAFPTLIVVDHPSSDSAWNVFLEATNALGFSGQLVRMDSDTHDETTPPTPLAFESTAITKPLFWNDLVHQIDAILSPLA